MTLNHVCNQHVTYSGDNICHHEPLDETDRVPWLEPGSAAHRALADVVLSPRTLGLSRHVATFRHTGQLEVFHSTSNVYTPKVKFFTYSGFVARKQAAVLDYTAHLNREFQRNKDGTVKQKRVYSRIGDRYVLRPMKVAKTYPHVRELLARVVQRRRQVAITGPAAVVRAHDPRRRHPLVHRAPRPDESGEALLLEAGKHSRF